MRISVLASLVLSNGDPCRAFAINGIKSATNLVLGASITSDVGSTKTATVVTDEDSDFIKPEPDNRQYRGVKLANNLKVLLVSAPDSDVEGASVHVQAGHMDDLADRAGLAHFHE